MSTIAQLIARKTISLPRAGFSIAGLGITLLLGLFYLLSFHSFTDADYFWHLHTGRWILDHRVIPNSDSFSFTAFGKPWVTHEWLAEVAIALVDLWGGYGANMALHGALFTASLGVTYRTVRASGLRWEGSLALTGWAALMMRPFVTVRPQVWTWLFLTLTVALLYSYWAGRRRSLWLLVPLTVLWVNLHAGYMVGIGVLSLSLLATLLHRYLRAGGFRPPARHQALIITLCLAAALISPHGPSILWYPITYLSLDDPSRAFISEWQSPDFHQPYLLPYLAGLVALLVVGAGRRPLEPWTVLLAGASALLSLQAERHVPLFAVAFPPIMAGALLEHQPGLFKAGPAAVPTLAGSFLNVALLACFAGVGGLAFLRAPGLQRGSEPALSVPAYPDAGSRYIQDHLPGARLFNTYHWGGFLIARLYPHNQVFIDGRADLYGRELMEQYVQVVQLGRNWQEVFDRHGVHAAVLEKDAPLAALIKSNPEWLEAFQGPVEVVLVRRSFLTAHSGPGPLAGVGVPG